MLEGSLGCGLQGVGLEAIAAALPHLALRASHSLRWSRELSGLRPRAEAWRSLWAADYRRMKESFAWGERLQAEGETSMARSPWVSALLPEDYSFKTNATLELFASATREARQAADRPCGPAPPTEWHSRGRLGQILLLIGPNGGGHLLLAIAWPNFAHADLRRCSIEVRIAATQALLGLRAYREERSRLPGSLDELVPEFLDEVPRDPFDGAPLRYRPEEKLVYSIGSDLADSGGAEQPDPKELREPRYPFAF